MPDEDSPLLENRPRLGKGLAALLGDAKSAQSESELQRGLRRAPIEYLRPNPLNPRKNFDETELEELTLSIRERGVIQPVLVRTIPGVADAYEIIAGERRWRAAQRAGQYEIPIIIVEAGDRDALEIAIIENVQRSDLNALEEAAGYTQLATVHGYSHSEIAKVVGKSRSHVANTMRLVKLPEHSREMLLAGAISAGHARALLSVSEPDSLADRIVAEGLTVRDVEQFGGKVRKHVKIRSNPRPSVDPDTHALQTQLSLSLGTKVTIQHVGNAGEIRITFCTIDQLHDICVKLRSTAAERMSNA